MVDIKKIYERLSVDELTAKSILEGFFKELRNRYRDNSSIDYLLKNDGYYFNYSRNVEQFEIDYNEKFHPVVKAYVDELVDDVVEYAKRCGARIYKPYWEDDCYYESKVRTESRLNRELVEFCELTSASDEVLTAIFNMAVSKLTELGIAWGSIDALPGACSDEPYYISSSQWVFQSYEDFKRIMARELYLEGESMFSSELYDRYKENVAKNNRGSMDDIFNGIVKINSEYIAEDEKIITQGDYEYSKISGEMKELLAELVTVCDWVGNEKLYAYAQKFKLELWGFGYGYEDDYIEQIALEFTDKFQNYNGKDYVEKCRFLMHETEVGNDYCYLKYEKRFDDLSESEKEIVLTKVINECFDMIQRK